MSEENFQFFLNQKKHIAVVSFLGKCTVGSIPQFKKCQESIGALVCKHIVLNFAGVTQIAEELDPVLVRLQVNIRERDKELIVCGFSSDLKKRLIDSGIIRTYETTNTLVEALQKIVAASGVK